MQTIFAYHFLQSLAFALINSIWQMAILWIFYNIITGIFVLKTSANYNLLVSIQTLGFCWFIYTFSQSLNNTNPIFYESNHSFYSSIIQEKLLPIGAIIYLFFSFVFATRFLLQFFQLKNIRNNELLPISQKWQQYVYETTNKIGINRKVQIKISKNIHTPLTIGFLKPIILIPIAAVNSLNPQQLEVILLHELAHIKRNDYLINLWLIFINTIMFFNPFSKHIYSVINKQREFCCDDTVLEYSSQNNLYAQALLNIAKSQFEACAIAGTMTAVNADHQELKHRIKRILNIELEQRNELKFNKQMTFSLAIGLLLFLLIGFINVNVNKVIADGIPASKNPLLINQNFTTTNYQKTNIQIAKSTSNEKHKIKPKRNLKPENKEANGYALKAKQNAIHQGMEFIGKLATANENNILVQNKIEENVPIDVESNGDNKDKVIIVPAIDNHPTTTVQKFFVPATTKSAASIIIVTTTEKENGKKIVKIEIEKGDGKVE